MPHPTAAPVAHKFGGAALVDADEMRALGEAVDLAFVPRYRTNPLVITGPGAGAAVMAAGVLNGVLKLAGAR